MRASYCASYLLDFCHVVSIEIYRSSKFLYLAAQDISKRGFLNLTLSERHKVFRRRRSYRDLNRNLHTGSKSSTCVHATMPVKTY